MNAYPFVVALPDGTQARCRIIHTVETNDKGKQVLTQLVSEPPQYERRDGTTVAIDVTIPDDLAALGWYWHGSTLARDGIYVHTATYGLPGVFAQARLYEAKREVLALQRIERAAAPTKKHRPAKQQPSAPTTVQQLAMEFV